MAEKRFGEDTYRCDKLDAEGGMRLLIRTTKMFGPASPVMASLSETDKTKKEAMSLQAIVDFVAKLDEDDAVQYVKDLIGLCRCNGEPAIFGVHVQDLGDCFQICMWVLEVQFSNFLPGSSAKNTVRKALGARG